MKIMKEKINNATKITIEPTHPLFEGLAGFCIELENGKISKATPELGFGRRNIEKAAQNKSFQEFLPFAERIGTDVLFYSYSYISSLEKILEIEPTLYAQFARVLTMELSRIYSHINTIGRIAELKCPNSLKYEIKNIKYQIYDILKNITNDPNMRGYYVLGGIKNSISSENIDKIKDFSDNFSKNFKNTENTFEKNPILLHSIKNIGFLDTQNALEYSITGVNLRASGLNLDFRKEIPYLVYNNLEFTVPTAFNGDCYSRFILRIDEIKASLHLINQCIDWILTNNNNKNQVNINISDVAPKCKTATSYTESPKGLIMCRLTLNENKELEYAKWRTPSFYAVQVLEKVLLESTLDDLVVIFNSLDIDTMEADR